MGEYQKSHRLKVIRSKSILITSDLSISKPGTSVITYGTRVSIS
jgi:hypothetical protein